MWLISRPSLHRVFAWLVNHATSLISRPFFHRVSDWLANSPTSLNDDPRLEKIRMLEQSYCALQSDLPFLDERIILLREVIAGADKTAQSDHSDSDPSLTSPPHHLLQLQRDLGYALYIRFHHIRDMEDLCEAQDRLKTVLKYPSQHADDRFPSASSLLGSVLREHSRELDQNQGHGVEEALIFHRLSLQGSRENSKSERAYHSRELGLTLRAHFRFGDPNPSNLHESIHLLRDARDVFASIGGNDLHSVIGLCLSLQNLSLIVEDPQIYIQEALLLCKEANASCKADHRDFYIMQYTLAHVLRSNSLIMNDSDALDQSILMLREGLRNAPVGWAGMLVQPLMSGLTFRFRKYHLEDDISEAIHLINTQLSGVDVEHAGNLNSLRERLAMALLERFRVTGAPEDVEEAVHVLNLILSKDQRMGSWRLEVLDRLAAIRGEQHRAFGEIDHLNECIAILDQTMSSRGGTHSARTGNLLEALHARHIQTGAYEDLDRAIELVNIGAPTWSRDSRYTPQCLAIAGNILLTHFKLSGSTDDLQRATSMHQEALKGPEIDSDDYLGGLLNYARTLRIRYETLGEDVSVTRALELQQQACNALPPTHPDHALALFGLAHVRLCISSNASDADEALDILLTGLDEKFCPAYRRLSDSLEVLAYLNTRAPHLDDRNSLKLLSVYSTAIALLHQVAPFSLGAKTRLLLLAHAGRLTLAYGALHAIRVNRVRLAVEMLEAGRGTFWSQSLSLRTRFDNLPTDLGGRLTRVARALVQPIPDFTTRSDRDRVLARRRRLGNEFDSALAEARLLPGFEGLLKNAEFQSLAQAARSHHIAIFIAAETSSYALILYESAEPQLVTLPDATSQSLLALFQSLVSYNQEASSSASRGMRIVGATEKTSLKVYEELWTAVMLPVIRALTWPKREGTRRPRLTLCPTGIFMQLPLHAAGIYTGEGRVSCADYLVASYTPSIAALLHAQNTSKPVVREDAETLLVAVNNPFKGTALPMTTEEANTLHSLVPSKIVQVSKCTDVLESLQSASILHLACHGTQNSSDALQSGFLLEDGLLTASKLMKLELSNAFLAVLSACETAKVDSAQPDQAIHLAATMFFAGFKSIIATMWYMGDMDGPVIAQSIYSSLFSPDKGSKFLDPDDIPYALDEAVQKLRNSGLDPSAWATYIHIGI